MNDRIEPEARRDRDLTPVTDSRDEKLRKLKEYLSSSIKASEADDPRHEHSGALREHADLDAVEEHDYQRLIREYRERQNK
jgi:hypothetical protein